MKGLYLIPGWMTGTEWGAAELTRRRAAVQRIAGDGWAMDAWEVPGGPTSIESATEEYQSVPGAIERLIEAERKVWISRKDHTRFQMRMFHKEASHKIVLVAEARTPYLVRQQ